MDEKHTNYTCTGTYRRADVESPDVKILRRVVVEVFSNQTKIVILNVRNVALVRYT